MSRKMNSQSMSPFESMPTRTFRILDTESPVENQSASSRFDDAKINDKVQDDAMILYSPKTTPSLYASPSDADIDLASNDGSIGITSFARSNVGNPSLTLQRTQHTTPFNQKFNVRKSESDGERDFLESPLQQRARRILMSSPFATDEILCSEDDVSVNNRYGDGALKYEEGNSKESSSKGEEDAQERQKREEEESEALARQLMAEEAMASYNLSTDFLRDHANEYSEEDLIALQAAMVEEDPEGEVAREELEEEGGMSSSELSYDTLLRIGERIGDVKAERWAMKAREEIEKLPTKTFHSGMTKYKDENDSDVKCLVCQCPFENGEVLRVLPCKHYFHHDCVDQWLLNKDCCPYCRQCIVKD